MSASSGPLASTKGDSTSSKASKPAYDHLDINKLYKGKSTEPVSKPIAQKHGMQILGKAIPARRPGQVSSLKADSSSSNDASNSATTSGPPSTNSSLAHSNQSQGNAPGWSSTHPHPPGPPSPRSAPNVPITGQHHHDKNWNNGPDASGPYQSQRFAQEFPSLASGTEASKVPPANASGPSSNVQGSQPGSKSQDNQYGPGPILRPQTEGSWTQGGGRGVARPPGPAPPINAQSREFQGPDRANLGGPTPPPMSLGQGGPAPPPLGAFPIPPPYRGMGPPPRYMYPNGPPVPGPGYYPPGPGGNMSRFAMTVPPRAPLPPSGGGPDGPQREMNRNRHLPPASQRPTVFSGPILRDEDLKSMDKLGASDGGWAATQDDVDYNKTICFDDEDDNGKENVVKKSASKAIESRSEQKGDRDENNIPTIERRPTKILDRQSSLGEARDLMRDRDQRESRFDNGGNKDVGLSSRGVSYGYENDEDWKAQQLPVPPPQQQQRRVNLYEDKGGDRRDPRGERPDRGDPRDRRDDRGGRRPLERRDDVVDNWRSSSNRQFDDDSRKAPPPRSRDEPRSDGRDFPMKTNNLPPRFQRQQQYQGGPGMAPVIQNQQQQQQQPNQRQTPSPGSSGGKDREFSAGGREWDREKGGQDRRRMDMDPNRKRDGGRDRYYNEYDSRNDRQNEKESRGSRYGSSDFQRERSKESDDSRTGSSGGSNNSRSANEPRQSSLESKDSGMKKDDGGKAVTMSSWADEMDDDENIRAQQLDRRREREHSPKPISQPKPEARRVYIRQTKISDMPPPKSEPVIEVKQPSPSSASTSEPAKPDPEQVEKPKLAWGEKEGWEKSNSRGEKEASPTQKEKSHGLDRRSMEKDTQSMKRQSANSSSPNQNHSSELSSSSNGPVDSKATPITKSNSARSISGEMESSGESHDHQHHLQRSNSISDASDRDHHLDREGGSNDSRSKPPYNRETSQDKGSSGGSTSGYDSKSKQHRPSDRDKRVKRDSDRDGSDVGSEHGGNRGDKSQRGQRNRDRGGYPVYRTRGERGGGQWERGNNRARGTRGRGGPGGGRELHSYDKLPKSRNDSERDDPRKDDLLPSDGSESQKFDDDKKDSIESQAPRKDVDSSEDTLPRPKKDKDLENSAKKSGKAATNNNKRNSNNNNNSNRGGDKLEGYGPPSDQKPFSTSSKDEDGVDKKEKNSVAGQKEGGIPSLMAVDISPPTLPQLKKGHRDREREFHAGVRSVPPRMQGQRGDGHMPERERHRGAPGSKRGGKDSLPSGTKKTEGGEDSEEWTDNDSDSESRKSGSAGSKSKREGHGDTKKAVKKPQQQQQQQQQQQDKGFGSNNNGAPKPNRPADKSAKNIRVKNPPYEARSSAHSNLPPRLAAAKQRDSQGPAPVGNGKPGENTNGGKGVEPAAPPQVNAWEKPITPTLRSDQVTTNSSGSSAPPTSALVINAKDSNEVELTNVPQISGSGSTTVSSAVLDGTNPPTRTLIFESRNYKGGVASDGVKAAVSKLPEAKKEAVSATSGIEFGKNLGSLGFGKGGAGEESPELEFTSSPLDDPLSVPQTQASIIAAHHVSSPKPCAGLLPQSSSRHSSFDTHQTVPTSRGDDPIELTKKIQSAKSIWDGTMNSVQAQLGGVCAPEDNAFHGAFVSDSFKGADSSGREFGSSGLPLSAVGYSAGGSPSMSAMTNPEASSSPNATMRPTSKTPQQQQQPPQSVNKSQGHGPGPIASPFGSYGMETPQHIGANSYGGIPLVPQPKFMFAPKVVQVDPFGSQMTQFQNAQAPSPYGQSGSVLIRPMEPKYQPMSYQHPGGNQNRPSGQATNHNRVSPGPITSSSVANSAAGAHVNSRSTNMMAKNQQTNRNAGHCMTQQVPPPGQQSFYHTHNPMSQQQVPKGPFGPANGGYSEGGITAPYQQQILIPVDMFNLSGNYDSSDLRSGPGPAPPGTPPVQAPSSNYYFGSNNNPAACVFPPNSSQNYGLPFTPSLKMPSYNSTGGGGSESGSNLGSQRIRPNEQAFIQQGMDPLPQNAMKSSHDFLMNQARWNSGNEFAVNHGVQWAAPGPIQRPIFNTPSAGPVGVPLVHSSSHYMTPNMGGPPGCVGMKPNNSSNDSMNNPGTPPKSPHPRKNV